MLFKLAKSGRPSLYEGILFVLFVSHLWDLPNWGISDCILDVFGKLSMRRGALAWSQIVSICGVEVLEYWMSFSLKIQLNHDRKFQSNWDVSLVLLERSRREGFNEISFLRFGLRMWEILNFKWFLSLKIQINCKKPCFGRKNRWRTYHAWRSTIQFKYEEIGMCLWYSWKDLDEHDLMEFIS